MSAPPLWATLSAPAGNFLRRQEEGSRQQHHPGTPRWPGTGCKKMGGAAGCVGGRILDEG